MSPRDFGPRGAPTTYFWDPDIIAVDPSFNDLAPRRACIIRSSAAACLFRAQNRKLRQVVSGIFGWVEMILASSSVMIGAHPVRNAP